MKDRKIITTNDYPPIPIRKYDWSAIREDYDEGDIIGYGETGQDSIIDLLSQEEDHLNIM
ncbi:MAG: hypothetical protein ACYC5G_05265 [Candidatus Doudnabacteria bacterium]